MRIGSLTLPNLLVVAPMAGVTDRPFRQLCKKFGAGLAISEMVSDNPQLWGTRKSQLRCNHIGESDPVSVQIVGTDPMMMAKAARYNVDKGAQLIDINMGCPAKKVCNVMAGSALMKDESLVARILESVVKAVSVPVTLKTRTGWDPEHRNVLNIAKIAESAGIAALTIHGRTRACGFNGQAEYDTIRTVKIHVKIPVIANGDIRTPAQARRVLNTTRADGIMIGRSAQGRPWLFREILHYLETGEMLAPISLIEVRNIMLEHLEEIYSFYGISMGARIARKHLNWYTFELAESSDFRKRVNQIESGPEQKIVVEEYFSRLINQQKNTLISNTKNLAA
ncbi:MAG: tRNA dihydrouridine synthase DusB [Pseudomonadota bacterium]|nr:tRNA dihydrouridine synthase DusB [Pseudomonadota bacterium]